MFFVEKFEIADNLKTNWLNVGDGHEIYYETSGNPKGIPVVRLHGGPGANSKTKNAQWYNPREYFIILFDQRGCGKSKPYGEIKGNTTQSLIGDMEKLRAHLGIDKWVVTGNSWGSTLSLLYAQAHPERVLALGIGAIFLGDEENVNWLYEEGGAGKFFPEKYTEFVKDVPKGISNFDFYAKEVLDTDDEALILKRSVDVLNFLGPLCDMELNQMVEEGVRAECEKEMTEEEKQAAQAGFECFAVNHTRLEMHYEREKFFIEEGQILADMDKIKHIPLFMVHGRYDLLCPVDNAYKVQQAHGNAKLYIAPDGGHSSGSEYATQYSLKMFNEDILSLFN